MDFKTIKGKNHYIYDSEQEFRLKYANYGKIKPWRDGEQGDWVFTDDKCVVQVLKKAQLKSHANRKEYYIRTICGQRMIRDKRELLGEISNNIYSFSKSNTKKKYTTSREIIFARYVASGMSPVESYKRAFPTNNHEYAKTQSRKLVTTTRVQTMIKEEIQKALHGEGVTAEYLIGRFKDIADLSERDSDKLRSLESLAKIAGIFDTNKEKEQLTVWTGFTPEQLNAIKGDGNARLEAHIERALPSKEEKQKM